MFHPMVWVDWGGNSLLRNIYGESMLPMQPYTVTTFQCSSDYSHHDMHAVSNRVRMLIDSVIAQSLFNTSHWAA